MSLREQLLNVARTRQSEIENDDLAQLADQECDFVKKVTKLKKDFVDLAKSGRLLVDDWVRIVPIPFAAIEVLYFSDWYFSSEYFKITVKSPTYQGLFAWLKQEGVETKVQKEVIRDEEQLGKTIPTFWLAVKLPQP